MISKIKIFKNKFFTENVTQVLLATSQILNVGLVSVHYFFSNMPKEFGQQGAVTIVLALISLSINKSKYEKLSRGWVILTINEKITLNERLQSLRDEAIYRTFDIHASQIAQMTQMLKIRTGFNRTDDQLEQLLNIAEGHEAAEATLQKEQDSAWKNYKERVAYYSDSKKSNDSWSGLLWKLEIAFVAVGTMQNAFGPDLVTSFHGM